MPVQRYGLVLSDLPASGLSLEYLLLEQQRQAEAEDAAALQEDALALAHDMTALMEENQQLQEAKARRKDQRLRRKQERDARRYDRWVLKQLGVRKRERVNFTMTPAQFEK